jgi:hypothetical protein
MRASVVMAVAVVLYIIARWTRNEPAVTLPSVLSGAFAIFIIALLDHGRTEEIAKGFAWLFAIVAAYAALPGIVKSIAAAQKSAAANVKSTVQGGGTASASA